MKQIVPELDRAKKCGMLKVVKEGNQKRYQAFQFAQAAQHTTLSKETIGRAVSLERESPVQCLQVSVSRPPTVIILAYFISHDSEFLQYMSSYQL
jgi:hypothetical protein